MYKPSLLIAVVTLLIAIQLPVTAQELASVEPSKGIEDAAHAYNVKIKESSYTSLRLGDRSFEAAIIDGYENIAPADYDKGVDFAIVRMSSMDGTLKDDYYKARLQSHEKISELGEAKLTMQLINQNGGVALEHQTVTNVFSVALPAENRVKTATIQLSTSLANQPGSLSLPVHNENAEISTIVCCDNGTCGQCIGPGCPI